MVIPEHENYFNKNNARHHFLVSPLNTLNVISEMRLRLNLLLSNIIIGKFNNFTNWSHIADNHNKIENN